MHIQIILCHPNRRSFNHAIAYQIETTLLANGHTVNVHDLYAEGFDPVLQFNEIIGECHDPLVNKHIAGLKACHGLVIIHPNWWGKPPAMLSGWIDRVMRMNMAYTFEKGQEGGVPVGLLNLNHVLIFNTSNTTPDRERNVFGDPLEKIWKECVFDFCGVAQVTRRMFSVVVDSNAMQREAWLNEACTLVAEAFPR